MNKEMAVSGGRNQIKPAPALPEIEKRYPAAELAFILGIGNDFCRNPRPVHGDGQNEFALASQLLFLNIVERRFYIEARALNWD